MTTCKLGIDDNDIIKFNAELDIVSASPTALVKNGKYSHKEAIVNFITKTDLAETKNRFVTNNYDGNCFETFNPIYYMCNDTTTIMVSLWVTYSYSNNEQIKTSDIELMNAIYGSSGHL